MITVEHISKHYKKKLAVDDLSFTVESGKVTGFLGPNGAGKSTTMRLMLGLDSGAGKT
jgi:ABC-2 type transport system ATP-binding protein